MTLFFLFRILNKLPTYTNYKMLHHQIQAPPPTVDDTMVDVSLTPCNRPGSAFNFAGWQKAPQHVRSQLSPRFTLPVTVAPSTDSRPKAVIGSLPLQFQLYSTKGRPLYEVRDTCPVTQNFKPCVVRCYNSSRKWKQHLH